MLRRAILSCLAQDAAIEVIVVANGPRVCANTLADAQELGVKLLHLPVGNVSLARYAGVKAAEGDFFCFLDDDDELLPRSISARLNAFDPEFDIVVSNGIDRTPDGHLAPSTPASVIEKIDQDLIGSFLAHNWFASAAALFRTRTVPRDSFNIEAQHFEWTILFFDLALGGYRFRYIDFPGFLRYEDNPASASKTIQYALAHPEAIRSIIRKHCNSGLEANHREQLHAKLLRAYNTTAQILLAQQDISSAWLAHLNCVRLGGWKYLSFTRHLLVRSACRNVRP